MAAPDPGAPAVLRVHANGSVVLEIADAEGEVRDYLVEPAPEGLAAWACTLRRLDGKAGPYRVERTPSGRWRCDCADTTIGRASREARQCKHRFAVSKLYGFMTRMIPHEQRHDQETQAG